MRRWIAVLMMALLLFATVYAENPDSVHVVFLGPKGTYTEEAAHFWFLNGEELVPKDTVNDAIEDMLAGTADFAVIPQENTLGGPVLNYVDALIAAENAYIVGEVVLPISQTLMGVPGTTLSDIRTICSHAQGLTQSAQWRADNLPEAETQEMASTAAAASYVAEQQDHSVAAVAAPGAAALYGLEVLAENVQMTDANKTRFYILSRNPLEEEGLTHAVFMVACEGSRIAEILAVMQDNGLELVSLHDRPEGSQLGRYYYIIEAKNDEGIPASAVRSVCALDGIRFAGCFNAVEKGVAKDAETAAVRIPGWTEDSAALASIVAYVGMITDENSPAYIPPEKRVVLFDSDGTLIGERYPTYSDQCMLVHRLVHDDTSAGIAEDVEFAKALEASYLNHEELPDSPRSTAQMAAESFNGFTVEEYQAYVDEFLKQPVPGFEGMTFGDRFFIPMIGLVQYLSENDFQVFICSGTERIFLREMIAGRLGQWIPPYRVIGSTFSLTAAGQGDTAGRSYTYTAEDQVLLEGNMTFKNVQMNKVVSIVDEIGVPPVLVFGNSSGDFAMGQYALQHGGRVYMLLCDDTARDYGDPEKAAETAEKSETLGFETISMRDDFQTIYAENITMNDTEMPEPAQETEDEALEPAA